MYFCAKSLQTLNCFAVKRIENKIRDGISNSVETSPNAPACPVGRSGLAPSDLKL